jgi:hypothetical protein
MTNDRTLAASSVPLPVLEAGPEGVASGRSPSALPTGIQLHLTTGRKHWFYQENAELVGTIMDDLDGNVFSKESLVIDGADEVSSFPGSALIGITILTDVLPESFLEKEKLSKTVVTQISLETFQYSRLQLISKYEGMRGALLSEIEFVSGERLYLEFSEVARNAMGERSVMHHLFSRPSISSRRPEGGFSIWNTAHIVSWSHYPKLDAPGDSWPAETLTEPITGAAKTVKML